MFQIQGTKGPHQMDLPLQMSIKTFAAAWSNMIDKRTDAPLHSKSLKMAELAQKASSVWQCENFMEEALRMIRKTDGEYATE